MSSTDGPDPYNQQGGQYGNQPGQGNHPQYGDQQSSGQYGNQQYGNQQYGNQQSGNQYGNQPQYSGQQYGDQHGYGQPGHGGSPKNGLGVAALILGIVAILSSFLVIGIILGIVAIILGVKGRGRVKKGLATNGAVALWGIITGAVGLVLSAVFLAIYIASASFFFQNGGQQLTDCLGQAGQDAVAQQQCFDQFGNQAEQQLENSGTDT
ncbi:DUF4190 domain-containing protein [Kineococcus gynurae]|uniref:DUF4190 domain-containing protein n=1 Tax=Kineococcus gynurae TaxID=452979 RepID=A0ABV5LSY7_9ACTN